MSSRSKNPKDRKLPDIKAKVVKDQQASAIKGGSESLVVVDGTPRLPMTEDSFTALSNLMKSQHDQMMAPINNLKG